jgi:membrane protease YdiL (CAAX protease family)
MNLNDKQVTEETKGGLLVGMDRAMGDGPWLVRLGPLLLWVGCMMVVGMARDWDVRTLPYLYTVQCVLTVGMLWRYRKLMPEVTLWFHWSVVPSAVFLTVAWIILGWWAGGEFSQRWDWLMQGMPTDHVVNLDREPHYFETMRGEYPWTFTVGMGLRLLGMSLIVPFIEEVFNRSLCLRAMHSMRKTGVAVLQVVHDLPGIGEWLMDKPAVKRAAQQEPMFSKQFYETPLGKVSVFGVAASTLIFTANHVPRDWMGAITCGVLWCLMVKWTNREGRKRKLGLGPVIWSHGLTNALLWGYTLYSGDWQFL